MAPWSHLTLQPNGDIHPCCTFDLTQPVGNINSDSLKDAWNSQTMRDLRLSMLSNQEHKGCARCNQFTKAGAESYRDSFNEKFSHHKHMVDTTTEDGVVDDFNLVFLDVRFSNLCNMKCRMCGPHYSSQWAEEQKLDKNLIGVDTKNIWDDIQQILPKLEQVYFAGGEPLIMEQHYRLLDMLDDIQHYPNLIYNSNGSKLALKDYHVRDYWHKFQNVRFNVSIDAIGKKAEYFRHGQPWHQVESNLDYITKNLPHVCIEPSITVNIFNILDINELVLYFLNKGIYPRLSNILTYPDYLSATILPESVKTIVVTRLEELLEEIKNALYWTKCDPRFRFYIHKALDNDINGIIAMVTTSATSDELLEKFIIETTILDQKRNENFATTFPELAKLIAL